MIFGVAIGAALFASAGTLAWPMGWAVVAFYAVLSLAGFALLPPDLIEERSSFPAGTTGTDLAIAGAAFVFLYPVSFVVCGLDFRAQASPELPGSVRAIAFAVFALGYAFSLWAAHVNRFFSGVVRVQSERGHTVVDRGPYAWVRHPGYAGPIAGHLALPIALGSLWGLVPAALGAVFLMTRIGYEERVLREGLPGYAAYAERVRWRLLPRVW